MHVGTFEVPILYPKTAPGTPHTLINMFKPPPYGCKLDEGSVSCRSSMHDPMGKCKIVARASFMRHLLCY